MHRLRVGRRLATSWIRPGVVVAAVLLLAGCGPTYPEHLQALRADPMASLELAGASVERRWEDEAETVLNKPSRAMVLTVYTIDAAADPNAVKAAALEAARDAGWLMEETEDNVVGGTKMLDTGAADLAVYFAEDYSGPEPVIQTDQLTILLEHSWGRPRSIR